MTFRAGQKLKASELGQLSTTAQYQASANQSITSAASTVVAFGTTQIASDLVTRSVSGAGHAFTFEKSGIWAVTYGIRYAAAANGVRDSWITDPAGRRVSSSQAGSAGAESSLTACLVSWFDAGTAISIQTLQNSGGAVNILFSVASGYGRLDLAYILGEDD